MKINPIIKSALINNTLINMTIEDIARSQNFVNLGTENSFIAKLPAHQKAYLIPQRSASQIKNLHLLTQMKTIQ